MGREHNKNSDEVFNDLREDSYGGEQGEGKERSSERVCQKLESINYQFENVNDGVLNNAVSDWLDFTNHEYPKEPLDIAERFMSVGESGYVAGFMHAPLNYAYHEDITGFSPGFDSGFYLNNKGDIFPTQQYFANCAVLSSSFDAAVVALDIPGRKNYAPVPHIGIDDSERQNFVKGVKDTGFVDDSVEYESFMSPSYIENGKAFYKITPPGYPGIIHADSVPDSIDRRDGVYKMICEIKNNYQ